MYILLTVLRSYQLISDLAWHCSNCHNSYLHHGILLSLVYYKQMELKSPIFFLGPFQNGTRAWEKRPFLPSPFKHWKTGFIWIINCMTSSNKGSTTSTNKSWSRRFWMEKKKSISILADKNSMASMTKKAWKFDTPSFMCVLVWWDVSQSTCATLTWVVRIK